MIVTFIKPTWIGPEDGPPHYQPGYVVDVSDLEARRLVATGCAVMGRVELQTETKTDESDQTEEPDADKVEPTDGKGRQRVYPFGRSRTQRDIS